MDVRAGHQGRRRLEILSSLGSQASYAVLAEFLPTMARPISRHTSGILRDSFAGLLLCSIFRRQSWQDEGQVLEGTACPKAPDHQMHNKHTNDGRSSIEHISAQDWLLGKRVIVAGIICLYT
jgi:hypothetical protein